MGSLFVLWLAWTLTKLNICWFFELWARAAETGYIHPLLVPCLTGWGAVLLGAYTFFNMCHQPMYWLNFGKLHAPTLIVLVVAWALVLLVPILWVIGFIMFLAAIVNLMRVKVW